MALLFTVLLGICVGVLIYFSFYFNGDDFISPAEEALNVEIAYLKEYPSALNDRIHGLGDETNSLYLLSTTDGKESTGTLSNFSGDLTPLEDGLFTFTYKGRTFAAKTQTLTDGSRLLVARDISKAMRAHARLQQLIFLSIFLIAIVVGASFLISRFVVKRTNLIALTAKRMMDTGDLSQRIKLSSRWDDLGNMTFVLNAFLARIEVLMAGIRQVSDNIAHDLKTPLTRLHTDFEALRKLPVFETDPKAATLLESMSNESGRLLDTFNALLRIARIETEKRRQNFKSLEIDRIVHDVIDLYEPLAQEKGICLSREIARTAPIAGDVDLLFQAFANILDNAIKFTPSSGRIDVVVKATVDKVTVTISDNGPGIALENRAKVFERFFRVDASRSSQGNGLGLALVAAIIELHNAEIVLEDAKPGLSVETKLQSLQSCN